MTLKLPPGETFSDGTDIASETVPDLEGQNYQEPEEDGSTDGVDPAIGVDEAEGAP